MLITRSGGRDITLIDPVAFTFNLLTSKKMLDQDLSCTTHLSSLVMIRPVIFVL